MLIIKDSSIEGAGKGLFTETFIPAGTRLFGITGEKIFYREFVNKYGNDTRYSIKVMNWYFISYKEEPFFSENMVVYINESNLPNVAYKKMAIYTTRDIQPNEEIFLRYPSNYPRDYILT